MKLEHQSDGSQGLRETWAVTRWALGIGAILVPAAVVFSQIISGGLGFLGLLGAGVGALGMLGVAAAISDLAVRFDSKRRLMRWEQRSWLRKRHLEMPFTDIRDVYIRSASTRSDDTTVGGYSVTHKLMITTVAGTLPLTMSEGSDLKAYEALRQEVLALLGRHGVTTEPSTLVERLVADGRLIDATAAIRAERGVDLATARAMVDAIRCQMDQSRKTGGAAVGH